MGKQFAIPNHFIPSRILKNLTLQSSPSIRTKMGVDPNSPDKEGVWIEGETQI